MRNEILRMLENNSRIDLHDLAIMLGTDESMVLEEIEKMENEGIICGYPTLINWDKTDTEKVTAFIEVRVTPQRGQGFEKLAERITNYPEVKSIYLMSGAFDFALRRLYALPSVLSPIRGPLRPGEGKKKVGQPPLPHEGHVGLPGKLIAETALFNDPAGSGVPVVVIAPDGLKAQLREAPADQGAGGSGSGPAPRRRG